MWHIGARRTRERSLRSFKKGIIDALALHKRNEVRSDGLTLECVSNRLEICWHARDVHPWDRHLPMHEQQAAFIHQLLEDTEAAVNRLFERLLQVDEIDVRVLDKQSHSVLASGTVQRSSLQIERDETPSIRMRLAALGIQCHVVVDMNVNAHFDEAAEEDTGGQVNHERLMVRTDGKR